MSKQVLGYKKLKRLRKKYNLDFIYGLVSHNHSVELYTRDKKVYHLWGGRLTLCQDPPKKIEFTQQLLGEFVEIENE